MYTALKAVGVQDDKALAAAALVATSKTPEAIFRAEEAIDLLFNAGYEEPLAEAVARAIANSFPSQRFTGNYNRVRLKTALVRAQWAAATAEVFLDALDSCIVTPRGSAVRAPIRHAPGAGKVVMCDFSFLQKPEMQKERRAIVVSSRSASASGRCTVVPVSKSRAIEPNSHHYRFEPGSYGFFHPTDPVWAICDNLYTVSLARLWQVNLRDRPTLPSISDSDLNGVRALAATAIGISALTE